MFETGRSAAEIIAAEGLGAQVADDAIEKAPAKSSKKIPTTLPSSNPAMKASSNFSSVMVMKATKGQASPRRSTTSSAACFRSFCSGRLPRRAHFRPPLARTWGQEKGPMLKIGDQSSRIHPRLRRRQSNSRLRISRARRVLLFFFPRRIPRLKRSKRPSFRDAKKKFDPAQCFHSRSQRRPGEGSAEFHDKWKLNFPLLSDPAHKMIESYGAWRGKKNSWALVQGIIRSSFLIGPDGKIEQIWDPVRAKRPRRRSPRSPPGIELKFGRARLVILSASDKMREGPQRKRRENLRGRPA